MLSVTLFHDYESVYQLRYLKSPERPTLIVCPNPFSADSFRYKLQAQESSQTTPETDVLTIAKFVADRLFIQDQEKKVWRKSEILKILSVAWKRYNTDLPQKAFFQAFKHITELRSFTLEYDLVKELLGEYGESMGEVMAKLWQLYGALDIYDEQRAYFEFSEKLRTQDHDIKNYNIIIWGFDFLNAYQVDLLKALSIHNDIYLPIPKPVYEKAISSDWVMWLEGDIHTIDDEVVATKNKIIEYDRYRLSEKLKEVESEYELDNVNIFLAENKPSINALQEIPFSRMTFKAPVGIFESYVGEMILELKNEYVEQSFESCINFVKNEITDEISKKEKKSFARLKALTMIHRAFVDWLEISDENQVVESFDLDVLHEIILLDSPRNFWLPSLNEEARGHIYGVEGIEAYDPKKKTFVIASGNYKGLKGRDGRYSEKMMEFLNAISPVPRSEFQVQFLLYQFQMALKGEHTYLIAEREIYESDQFWGELIDPDTDEFIRPNSTAPKKRPDAKVLDRIIGQYTSLEDIGHLSASKIQSYLDCPRKYFFNYCHRLNAPSLASTILMPNELGEVEHRAVGDFFLKNKERYSIAESAKETLDSFLNETKKTVENERYDQYLLEVRQTLQNAVSSLEAIQIDPKSMSFERSLTSNNDFSDYKVVGSIDFLGEIPEGGVLIDFKRSKSSIPSRKDIESLESIQAWFYLNFLPKEMELSKLALWGYLCLRDPKESLLFTTDESLKDDLAANPIFGSRGIHYLGELENNCMEFSKTLHQHIANIGAEKSFPARPIHKSVCYFCSVANLCSKGAEV